MTTTSRELSGHDDETLLGLLEEAVRARVLEELGPNAYRFTHALMQETLLDEVTAARRVRLHARIAEALERRFDDARDTLPQLASHYAEAAVLGREVAVKAAHFSRLAAEQAAAALGYEEAIRHYERCLALIAEAGDSLGEDEAALWGELAVARRTNTLGIASAALARALSLYRERDDAHAAGRLVIRFYRVFLGALEARLTWPVFDDLIGQLPSDDSDELCGLLAARSAFDLGEEGDRLADRAKSMAVRLGLRGSEFPWRLRIRDGLVLVERGDFSSAAAVFDQVVTEAPDLPLRTAIINNRTQALVLAGEVERVDESLKDAVVSNRRWQRALPLLSILAHIAEIAWRRGDLHHYEELVADLPVGASASADTGFARVARERGFLSDALGLLPDENHPNFSTLNRQSSPALRSVMLLDTGEADAARAEFAIAAAYWRTAEVLSERGLILGGAADAIPILADEEFGREVVAFLGRYPALRYFTTTGGSLVGNADVLRGHLALRFDRGDEAEGHFRTGLEWASRPDVRFVIDQGRCLQGLAEVAELRGDIETARAHLDAAGELFAKYGAKLYLDQVLAKKQVLRA